ncbi:MAG: glycosyltransferase family 2 protein [Cyanobacteria bacterium TGS_CYA1]|nr:glycosyltransferase family 2 protein [Cyanobacteria bacterium TGS_CYA1]
MPESTDSNYKLSVVIPMYNEEAGAAECVRRVDKVVSEMGCQYELIFVNDGSRDKTLQILIGEKEKNPNVRIIDLSRNFGHQLAIRAGIEHSTGDALIVIDGDLQDPPELFPDMVRKWRQEGFDIVHARRKTRQGISAFADARAKLFYQILSSISTVDIPRDVGDFRLISKPVIDNLKKMREQQPYVRGQAAWVGYPSTIIEYDREKRFAGEPQYTLMKLLHLCFSGITGFSRLPLRLGIYLGALLFAVGILFVLLLLIYKNRIIAWAPSVIAISFVGSLQSFVIGIIGEYLAIVLDHSRGRPLYVVKNKY